jgi:DHA2 family multidrug resistance protein
MPIIGVLTGRIDSRWMIAGGFFAFGVTSLWMGGLTLQISQWSLLWPIIISGMASGMIFVPLSTTAMGTLPNQQIGNASGLYNLLRNVGGSIGISIVNTLVSRHQQVHRSELVQHLAQGRLALEQRLQALQQLFGGSGPGLSEMRAYGVIEQTLSTQAALWSYVDDFRYLALACFFCIPIALFLKRVRATGGPSMAH